MNIDLLINMANEIGDFFTRSRPSRPRVMWRATSGATGIRVCVPQILQYYEERHGAGLTDVALGAIAQLKAEKAAPAASPRPGRPDARSASHDCGGRARR